MKKNFLKTLIIINTLLILFVLNIVNKSFAQLPVCDKIYLDQSEMGYFDFGFTSNYKIYNYDPLLPASATNPSLNSITLPTNANGLTVGEVLGSGDPTLTFYTVVSNQYWYYNPSTSTWVNTGHSTGSTLAVNIASGGGYIYNLVGSTGEIYKYDGTGNGSLLTTITDFPDAGPWDLIADCAGNFYILRFSPLYDYSYWLRKYSSSGALLQSWTVNNPNAWFSGAGFGIIGQDIYIDEDDDGYNSFIRIAEGNISGSTITVNTESGNLPPYNMTNDVFYTTYMIGDMGSCASSVPVLPTITISGNNTACENTPITFNSTINAGGSSPQYQWYVNGVLVSGANGSSFTYNTPQNGDVITCELTSNEICVSTSTALSNSITLTISPGSTPTFTQVGPYCTGATISALPTTSNNGITGTWSPAVNNTTTTTYTFTPNAGQCAANATMTITINPSVTPTFTQAGPYCTGATIPALPTTSNNSITGTWTPAINNTSTTTYTFTPAAGQCASTTTMTIAINSSVTPTFTQVGPFCIGATIPALPTTSNNGITGTWSPAINNNATTTYTFTPSAGQCGTTTTMTITINPTTMPTFTQVGPYCTGATIPALPTTSNNGITGTWSPAINNTATTTYTFTPAAGQCGTTTTMTVTINPATIPTFTPVGPYCSGASIPALPTTSNNGISGTWSPAINNTATTTYTFTPNTGQCASNATMTIAINPVITPTFTQVGPYCSGATISALPTTSNNGISGSWSPTINNTTTTTYTFTPTVGLCATTTTMTITINPVITPTFTQVGPYCSGATISALPTTSNNGISGSWSPTINNTTTTTYTFTPSAGQCASTSTMTITINPNITPTFTPVGAYCIGATIPTLPTTSNNGITGTWSPAINNMATTTYTFTPNTGQCATNTTLTITINTNATPTFTQVGPYCSGATIPALPITSNDGIIGMWSPAINNTATTTYTFTPNPGQCASNTSMTITINPEITPTFTQVGPYCAGATIPALATTSNNGISGTWSPALNNTTTTTYTFTPNAGQCGTTTNMVVVINPAINSTVDTTVCQLPFTWNNININQYGNNVANATLQTQSGCDSIVTLNVLQPPPPALINIDTAACDSMYFNGQTLYADTTFIQTIPSVLGCDSIIVAINISINHFNLSLSANIDTIVQGAELILNTTGDASYSVLSWQPSTLFPNQNATSQIFIPNDSATYIVIAQSAEGCIDTASIFVYLLPTSTVVIMPNAFSPNGDGLNDYFGPVFNNPLAVTAMTFHVFNRFGQLVYKSQQSTDKGWDGTLNSKKCDMGVYFYYFTYELRDGSKNSFKGDCQLIR